VSAVDLARAAFLGALQGATEFLPVSSSGHLIIVPELLGWPPPTVAFHVAIHLATMLAVAAYFRRDWQRMASGALRGLRQGAPWRDPDGRLLVVLIVATIPAALAGLALEAPLEAALVGASRSAARGAAAMLLVTSALLVVSDRAARRHGDPGGAAPDDAALAVGWRQALWVGIAQACAILPGVSRSGATIAAGLLGGLSRPDAARLSFLLGTPIILGAAVLELGEPLAARPSPGELAVLLTGMASAGVAGYAVIAWLLGYVRRRSILPFAAYTAVAGLVVLALLAGR